MSRARRTAIGPGPDVERVDLGGMDEDVRCASESILLDAGRRVDDASRCPRVGPARRRAFRDGWNVSRVTGTMRPCAG
ncbi:hypothetical protein DMO24_18975 [Modestobacter versicolor]|uniref:Uncharacterized protein n=1 Tax=Modestobacter versicolor TaxID=429133 RepID=A0A323V6S5_9ACTN|nr:hypothetical protein DMO24_18975 [Modestobacter versicolor]